MVKSRIRELETDDVVRCFKSTGESFLAKVKQVVTDMTHYRDIAYVTSFEGKDGSLTDNCEWIFVAGKVSQSGQNNSRGVEESELNDETNDLVNQPSHYTYGSIENIDYVEQVTASYPVKIAFSIGNVIKYISRAPFKNGVEDLKKAAWYLDRAVKKWEDANNENKN